MEHCLGWICKRLYSVFKKQFVRLKLLSYNPHTLLRYWLSGGLKKWILLGEETFGLASKLDNLLSKSSTRFDSFVDIEIERID